MLLTDLIRWAQEACRQRWQSMRATIKTKTTAMDWQKDSAAHRCSEQEFDWCTEDILPGRDAMVIPYMYPTGLQSGITATILAQRASYNGKHGALQSPQSEASRILSSELHRQALSCNFSYSRISIDMYIL